MSLKSRVDLARSGLFFVVLLALVPLAFGPSYLSTIFDTHNPYVHLHAITATLWILMLIAQPLAIGARRFTLHRLIGKASYVLAPLVVVSMVLLGHSKVQGRQVTEYAGILYLQLSLAALFALSAALAIRTRRKVALHSRFMVCTGLTMIDPVVARVMYFWLELRLPWSYGWITFGLTDLILLALIWLERDRSRGRMVFPAMLVVFMLAQVPYLFKLTKTPVWQAFASWFAALPLT